MTAYNRELYIGEAIASVLASTYHNYELIIVDDCSTDNTVEIAKQYKLHDGRIKVYVNEKNLGDYPNRNKAAAYACGKYLKYLDSDDTISSKGLEIMVDCMEKYPAAGYGLIAKNMDPRLAYPVLLSGEQAYKEYFFKCALFTTGPSGSIMKRDLFETVGGFMEMPYISDTELWLRLSATGPVVCMSVGLVWWRQHAQQQVHEGVANLFYQKQTLRLHIRFLEDVECPLQKKDAAIALRNQRNIYTRKAIRYFFKFEFSKGIELVENNNLHFSDFILSLKRNVIIDY